LVPKSSAVVPGTVNVEAIALHKDHFGMAKFASPNDEDYRTLSGHLSDMVSKAPQKVAAKWAIYKRQEGVWL
jgi:hypothetical protein